MSYVPPADASPDLPTSYDEDRNRGEDGVQTIAASSSTIPGVRDSTTPTTNPNVHRGESSDRVSTAPSKSLDRKSRRTSSTEGQEGVALVDSARHDLNEGPSEAFEEPGSSAGSATYTFRRLAEAQQQPVQPALSDAINTLQHRGRSPRVIFPAGSLKSKCEELRKKQEAIHINVDGPSRTPVLEDFPRALSMKIVNPTQPVESCIVLMHNLASNEASLNDHVEILKSKYPESAIILLRGLRSIEPENSGYHWADANGDVDEGFINTSRVILEDIIQDVLLAKCRFHPREIVILGHGQGGMAALAATACWNCIEFGGVVSLGGPMPAHVQVPSNIKAKTPVLIYGGARGDIALAALQQILENFSCTDHYDPPSGHDTIPLSEEEIAPLLEFFAHRLRREEWKRQAVISFDGGGIRGYGSLLILKELMNMVGKEEKDLDRKTESSFWPSDYKPTIIESANTRGESANSRPSDPSETLDAHHIGPSRSRDLPNSALFLPCHYFTYAAGTSTGGLISIMLSRLRMTVDDCIEEYKSLGGQIFGHPRWMAIGGFPWHRYSAKVLQDVIRGVTTRHYKRSDFESLYGMEKTDKDMCQCVVLAYSDHVGSDSPYLFRTYANEAQARDPDKTSMRQRTFRNPGGAAMLPIWKVARATSAAPGYFPPIKIETGNGLEMATFKDGGFGSNNPSEEAYKDILIKDGGIMHMGPFISIGTGLTRHDMFAKKSDSLSNFIVTVKAAIKQAARTLRAHENMLHHACPDGEEKFPYYRFDGGKKLGEVDLGEWESHRFTRVTGKDRESGHKTLEKIETAMAVYLRDEEVHKDLMECAKLLVKRRRLRVRNESEWDRYASYSYYMCDMKACSKREVNTAHDLKEHLRREHKFKLADPVVDKKVRECRRVKWLYRSSDNGEGRT